VVCDGDGSLLMNLGTLSTLARTSRKICPRPFLDNESLLSVRRIPTARAPDRTWKAMRALKVPRFHQQRSHRHRRPRPSDGQAESEAQAGGGGESHGVLQVEEIRTMAERLQLGSDGTHEW